MKAGFQPKPAKSRKHDRISIYDPDHLWYKSALRLIHKHSEKLYADEQRVTDLLKLFIKYGDACIQAITRERHAVEKRNTTKAQREDQALKNLDGLIDGLPKYKKRETGPRNHSVPDEEE